MSLGPPATGELAVVGVGMQLGRHVSRRVEAEIAAADEVLALVDAHALAWLRGLRPDVISLHGFYAEGKDRRTSYREMEARILRPVRAGRHLCLVLYGHPAVFADVSHGALRRARTEGHRTRMEPGISAEACLYADLAIDPGARGVQSFEATQFLAFRRIIDPTALLILWQIGLCGDLTCRRFDTTPGRLRVLVEKLHRAYECDPEVILYEAPRLPIEAPRADRLALSDLPDAWLREHTTLVIPPVAALEPDPRTREALALSDP